MTSVQAVSFDLDGTLYDAKALRWRFAMQNWRALRFVRVTMRVREELRQHAFASGHAYRREEAARVAERLDVSAQQAREQIDFLLGERLQRALRSTGPRTDAREALRRLVEAQVRIAVTSDYAPADKLAALGLDDFPWAAQVAADALGALKPHPRAYEACVHALGLPAGEVLHIGDRIDTDVRGAQGAGLKALWLGPGAPEVRAAPSLLQAVEQILTGRT